MEPFLAPETRARFSMVDRHRVARFHGRPDYRPRVAGRAVAGAKRPRPEPAAADEAAKPKPRPRPRPEGGTDISDLLTASEQFQRPAPTPSPRPRQRQPGTEPGAEALPPLLSAHQFAVFLELSRTLASSRTPEEERLLAALAQRLRREQGIVKALLAKRHAAEPPAAQQLRVALQQRFEQRARNLPSHWRELEVGGQQQGQKDVLTQAAELDRSAEEIATLLDAPGSALQPPPAELGSPPPPPPPPALGEGGMGMSLAVLQLLLLADEPCLVPVTVTAPGTATFHEALRATPASAPALRFEYLQAAVRARVSPDAGAMRTSLLLGGEQQIRVHSPLSQLVQVKEELLGEWAARRRTDRENLRFAVAAMCSGGASAAVVARVSASALLETCVWEVQGLLTAELVRRIQDCVRALCPVLQLLAQQPPGLFAVQVSAAGALRVWEAVETEAVPLSDLLVAVAPKATHVVPAPQSPAWEAVEQPWSAYDIRPPAGARHCLQFGMEDKCDRVLQSLPCLDVHVRRHADTHGVFYRPVTHEARFPRPRGDYSRQMPVRYPQQVCYAFCDTGQCGNEECQGSRLHLKLPDMLDVVAEWIVREHPAASSHLQKKNAKRKIPERKQ